MHCWWEYKLLLKILQKKYGDFSNKQTNKLKVELSYDLAITKNWKHPYLPMVKWIKKMWSHYTKVK